MHYVISPLGCNNNITIVPGSESNIVNSYFVDLNDRAIYYSGTNPYTSVNVKRSYFDSISSDNIGGAVLFNTNGKLIFKQVFARNCKTAPLKYGQFCYSVVNDDAYSNNDVIESSLTYTGSSTYGWAPLYYKSGITTFDSLNITSYKVHQRIYSVTLCYKDVSIKCCNIVNNNSSEKFGIVNDPLQPRFSIIISNMNLLNNTVSLQGVVFCHSTLIIKDSNIVDNTEGQGNLFYLYPDTKNPSTVSASNCFISNPHATSSYGSVNFVDSIQDSVQIECILAEKCSFMYVNTQFERCDLLIFRLSFSYLFVMIVM